MPQYLYTSADGVTITETQSAKAPIPCEIVKDGVTYRRDIVREHAGFSHHPGNWPQVSNSIAVLRQDFDTEVRDNESHGLNISYKPDPTGNGMQPVFTSREQRAKYMAAKGYYDRDAGYGDKAPDNAGTRRFQCSRFG